MEPIEIKESLKTCPRNEFREIMEDFSLSLEERYTALYTRSLQPDVFNHYHPRPIPRPPTTWNKDYEDYKILTDANKAQGWRKILVKYAGYIKREIDYIRRFEKLETKTIPPNFDYSILAALSNEGKEKLAKFRPRTIGQASRISGVSPTDVSVLSIFLKNN